MVGTEESGKSAIESGIHNPEKTSPIVVEKYLNGINFPASKQELIQQAKNNDAPDTIIQSLDKIADEQCFNVTEVARETSAAK